ncbi:MAG TPA: cyclase family protein [Planctomycetota bacterium]|nr:cyclase family protein [Planctomycetota bacterium]
MIFTIDQDKYRVVDLSYQVVPPGTPDRPFVIQRGRLGDNAYKFDIVRTHTHVGTHVESPAHFYPGGKDVTELPLDTFFGRAVLLDVADATQAQQIAAPYLDKCLGDVVQHRDIVLCRNSDTRPGPHPCLTPEAAIWMRDREVKMVGIGTDFSLGATITAARAFHDILMSQDVCLVEFLDSLGELRRREFFFMALPFKCAQIDSATARAVAIEEI